MANKIYEQMVNMSPHKGHVLPESSLLEAFQAGSPTKVTHLLTTSKRLLSLAQNFGKELGGLCHLQSIYLPLLEEMVAKRG